MFRTILCFVSLLFAAGTAVAEEATETDGERRLGMSIVGNDEAPKSLVIVPWKTSELGDMLDVSRALDDGRQPVDRDVFNRQLDYYQIRLAPAAMRVSEKQ
jgi:hypothetical protein